MKLIQVLLTFFVLCIASFSNAENQIPYYGEEFYSNPHLSGDPLKQLLHRVLTEKHQKVSGRPDKIVKACETGAHCYEHTSLSYEQAKSFLLSKYYLVQSDHGFVIRDVYCETDYPAPGPTDIPDSNVLNIEHTWPQSRFVGKYNKNVQKADMHHLFPSDSQLNAIRGNHPFGEVDQEKKVLKCPVSRFGIVKDTKQLVFEPPKDHRGNVARALFYFSLRYEISIDEKQEVFLREWHKADPVDQEELDRNEEIFKLQQNRNPFVEMPELAERIQNF